jgi:hypothetical protein
MATKADFTEDEWKTLQRGVTGAGMLVSSSDPDFTDSFGEASALAKKLLAESEKNENALAREIAHTHGTGFGMFSSREKVETETLEALRSATSILAAKAPDDVAAYRQLTLDVAEAVADAKGGVKEDETAAIGRIKEALGAA